MEKIDFFLIQMKSLTKKKGMTMKELMEKIGKGVYLFQSWQTNRSFPPSDLLYEISKVLGVSMNVFFEQETEEDYEVVKIPIFKNLNNLSQEDVEELGKLSASDFRNLAELTRSLRRILTVKE